MDEFVAEVDEAIRDGKVPPTSKTPELIQTIACALHVHDVHRLAETLRGKINELDEVLNVIKTAPENK